VKYADGYAVPNSNFFVLKENGLFRIAANGTVDKVSPITVLNASRFIFAVIKDRVGYDVSE